MTLTIEAVIPGDGLAATWIDHLQTENSHAVGFLTRAAIAEAIERERVLLAFENGDPAGYIIHGALRRTTRILQVVVADDARRIEHGTALVGSVVDRANANHAHSIMCHVADDLDANAFWQALGMTITGGRRRAKDRNRTQNRYEADLPARRIHELAKTRKIAEKGLQRLHSLLSKGGIDLAEMKLPNRRPQNHHLPNPYPPDPRWPS